MQQQQLWEIQVLRQAVDRRHHQPLGARAAAARPPRPSAEPTERRVPQRPVLQVAARW